MALIEVPAGELAAVVTRLEMLAPPRPRPMPAAPFRLARWRSAEPARYRALFARVGTPWLWYSRLVMDDARLGAILADPAYEIHVVADRQGVELGLLELDFRQAETCNIAFFGLVPEITGRGVGGWLMAHALALGWRANVRRMWVHTCSLDHPAALGFYRKWGFAPYARALETFPDPRLTGVLPRDAAPQIPIVEPSRR